MKRKFGEGRPPIADDIIEQMMIMRRLGIGMPTIAKELHINISTVKRYVIGIEQAEKMDRLSKANMEGNNV
jgi:flavorubredoxin